MKKFLFMNVPTMAFAAGSLYVLPERTWLDAVLGATCLLSAICAQSYILFKLDPK